MSATRYIVGCMTGTSLDGLDAAMVQVRGSELDIEARLLGVCSRSLGELAQKLRTFTTGVASPPIDYLRAARRLGELHAEAIAQACDRHLPADAALDFVVAHGQTIWHAPADEAGPLSWQLFDPWPIVRRLRVPVCYDLRQADLIAGGQGAPITPIADWVLYRRQARSTLVVNLGGICNVTLVRGEHPDEIRAADIGPCNLVIDGVVKRLFPGAAFDRDGTFAARGTVHDFAHEPLRKYEHAGLEGDRPSLGREDFTDAWINDLLAQAPKALSSCDVAASVVDAVGRLIGATVGDANAALTVLAGGGARHPVLVQRIRQHARDYLQKGGRIVPSDELGIPCEAREATGFAILGALSQDGVPITLGRVTGADKPGRAGAWVYP